MTTLLESSVVRIYSNKGKVIGAGFLVSPKRILTCAHVVASSLGIDSTTSSIPEAEISLDFPGVVPGKMFTAKVVFWRPVHPNPSTQAEFQEDIAALELSIPLPEAVRPVQLVTSEDLWGHPFRVLGFPDGKQNGAWASGELRAPIASGWVQLEDVKGPGYRLEEGFSGAPVWDEKLQAVVGMAVAAEKKRTEAKAAFIIPTSLLVKAWHELSEQAIPSCPYRGLFAFQEEDAPFFCGRETFTEQLLVAVQKKPLVAVIGASGSGKSSVVFAGCNGVLRKTLILNSEPITSVSFSLDGQMIACAVNVVDTHGTIQFGTVKLWSCDGVLRRNLEGHNSAVSSVSFSPDSQTIASASYDGSIKLWRCNGELLRKLEGHSNWVMSVSFSPDGQTIASASADCTIKLWNLDGVLLRILKGHSNWVMSVSFSPDGQTIASASADCTIKLWNLDGMVLGTLNGHEKQVNSVSFSPDGKRIASASWDKTLILWNLDLDNLLVRGCNWLRDYLRTNPNVSENDRNLCESIYTQNYGSGKINRI